jgi:hypothetical protein
VGVVLDIDGATPVAPLSRHTTLDAAAHRARVRDLSPDRTELDESPAIPHTVALTALPTKRMPATTNVARRSRRGRDLRRHRGKPVVIHLMKRRPRNWISLIFLSVVGAMGSGEGSGIDGAATTLIARRELVADRDLLGITRWPLTFVTAQVWEGIGHRVETVMASTVTFHTYRWFAARYWSSVTGSNQVVPSPFAVPSSMARWHMRIAQARQLVSSETFNERLTRFLIEARPAKTALTSQRVYTRSVSSIYHAEGGLRA